MPRKKVPVVEVPAEEPVVDHNAGSVVVYRDRAGAPRGAVGSEGAANIGAVTAAARAVTGE